MTDTENAEIPVEESIAYANAKLGCKTCYGRGMLSMNYPNIKAGGFIRDNTGNPVVFNEYCTCVKHKLAREAKERGPDFVFKSYKVIGYVDGDKNQPILEVLRGG